MARVRRQQVIDWEKQHVCDVVLRDHGLPVQPTRGDVNVLGRACARLLAGEVLTSTTPEGKPVRLTADHVEVGGKTIFTGSAYDCAVTAYGVISDFNVSWSDLDDGVRVLTVDDRPTTLDAFLNDNAAPDVAPLEDADVERVRQMEPGEECYVGFMLVRRVG